MHPQEAETVKRVAVRRDMIDSLHLRAFVREDTAILASLSGITPLPVMTQTELMIDADWYRHFVTWLDTISHGRSSGIITLLSFLVIGGTASVLNLIVIVILGLIDHNGFNSSVKYLLYSGIATEISIIFNFSLNDRFTFRSRIAKHSTWLQRCLRFHGPASIGFVLTLALSRTAYILLSHYHYGAVIAQAISIIFVTSVNFTMHRFWTYRKPAVDPKLVLD